MRHLAALICLVGFASSASGQGPGTVEFSVLGVWHNKTVPMDALRGFGAGGRLAVWLPAGFGIEGQADLTLPANSAIVNRFKLFHVAGSALYNIPVGAGSFYLRAGYGKLIPRGCEYRALNCPSFGAMTASGGVRIPVAPSMAIRAEGMYRTRSIYNYSSFGGSVGLTVLRGGGGGGGAGPDADGDGVSNRRDRCRETPRGALVDQRGCPTDLDQDGVPDGVDRCPRTPAGTSVDAVGCPARRPTAGPAAARSH